MNKTSAIEKVFGNNPQLSPEQHSFQREVIRINELRVELKHLTEELAAASAELKQVVEPLRKEFFELLKRRLEILADQFLHGSHSRHFKSNLQLIIKTECEKLLEIRDDASIKKIFEDCLGIHYGEYILEKEELEEDMEDYFRQTFEREEAEEEPERKQKTNNKREAKEHAIKEAQSRSVKEIYRDLMKVCHPDKEQDEEKKAEKEEISKKITAAYKEADLLALLEYELQFLGTNKDRIREMAAEKLKLYNQILKEQKMKLEVELSRLKIENEMVYRGMCMKNSKKKNFLSKIKRQFKTDAETLKEQLSLLTFDKTYLKSYVMEYISYLNDDDDHF